MELNAQGTITSIFDQTASRDIVTSITQQEYRFNGALEGENLEFFLGGGVAVPEPASLTIAAGMVGPVAASIRVENPAYPIAASEIILYEGLDRIDIVNTPDRDEFTYAPLGQNSRYYGFTFPFDLADYTEFPACMAGPAFMWPSAWITAEPGRKESVSHTCRSNSTSA